MSRQKQIVTDIETLKQLTGIGTRSFFRKIVFPIICANIFTILIGVGAVIKNYVIFLDTVKTVEEIQKVQRIHLEEINHLKILEATHEVRIINLENNKYEKNNS